MTKEVAGLTKLQIKGDAVNPPPPVGSVLGPKGTNIVGFCKEFSARTQDKAGKVLPVVITYYNDKSSSFIIKTPPAAAQPMETAKVKGGPGGLNRKKVVSVAWEQARAIVEDKMPDLNYFTVESAMKPIADTIRSMSTTVRGDFPGK